jgi:hypothetical protein
VPRGDSRGKYRDRNTEQLDRRVPRGRHLPRRVGLAAHVV